MCGTTGNCAFKDLFASIKYAFESKQGKYSISTYLDIIGEFTDRLILETERKENMQYIGGECSVTPRHESREFLFLVKLFFNDKDGGEITKEANRTLSINRFTSEAIEEIGNGKKYEIIAPEARR